MVNKLKRKKIFYGLIIWLIFSLYGNMLFAASVVLTWGPPSTNADESPLNDLAGYYVYYGQTSGIYSESIDVGDVLTYQVNNLSTGVTYYFTTTAYDTSGNESVPSNEISKTFFAPDTTSPVVSGVQATNITSASVTIGWTTDEASDARIEYGTSLSYGSTTAVNTAMVTSHSQNISGLMASTQYHYRVVSVDASGNQGVSGDNTFTTQAPPDTTSPVVSGVQATNVTSASVTIGWTTDEASDTRIEYGTSLSYGSTTVVNTAMVTSHSQNISGLMASTQYHYRVVSVDASGNQGVSGDNTFTTQAPPDTTSPVVSGVQATNVTSASVTIGWTTDEASDTRIEYGTSLSYGSTTVVNTAMVTSHSQNISGLMASTQYHYRVVSVDASGNQGVSGDNTFTTQAPPDTTSPVASGVQATNVTSVSVTIGWTTDEASDARIEYGTSLSYGSTTAVNAAMVTSHSQNISGLTSSTQYHYRVVSVDASGNQGVSGDNTFTTQAPPAPVDYYCDSDIDGYINITKDGSCVGPGCVPAGCQTTTGNDCNDGDPYLNPGIIDDTCDGVDNNCDGTPDNYYVTAAISCGIGVCTSTGQIICQSGTEVNTCRPGIPAESAETTCSDGLDNDCDGLVDEGCYADIKVSNVLLSEDFSSGMPATWSVQGGWSAINPCAKTVGYPFTGQYAIVDSSCTTTNIDEAVTESINTVSCSSVALTFSNQYDSYAGNIEVDVSNDGGTTWANNLIVQTDDGYPLPNWKELDVSSIADVTDAKIKFRYANSTTAGFWALDNVWVTCQSDQMDFSTETHVPSSRTLMISNTGTDILTIDTVNIAGFDAAEFSIGADDNCTNQTLLPAETCTVDVVLMPKSAGVKNATLAISSNDPDTSMLSVPLKGTVTNIRKPVPVIKVNNSFGVVNIARGENVAATIALDPGSYSGTNADWWVLMEYRNRWYYYDALTNKWRRGFSFYKQGQLKSMGQVNLMDSARWSSGQYTLYFGVDTSMNGIQDTSAYYYDTVIVDVQ